MLDKNSDDIRYIFITALNFDLVLARHELV